MDRKTIAVCFSRAMILAGENQAMPDSRQENGDKQIMQEPQLSDWDKQAKNYP